MAKLRDQDIISNIIIRLPVKAILRFRCVSKAWCKLLKDPDFVKKHLSHAIEMNKFSVMMHPCYDLHEEAHTLAYDPSSSTLSNPASINYPLARKFWGTCNGLICLTTTNQNDVVLWNPTTQEFKEVPTVPIESADEFSYYKHGFGCGDEIDDFKVVSFVVFDGVYFSEVRVYTLKSNSWRRLENIPYWLCHGEMDMSQVSVHGSMHWLAFTDTEPSKVIVSFDFKDNRFDEMRLPSFDYAETNLCPLGGSLCLHGSIYGRIDIWEMKEYAVTESWVKLFTINQADFFRQLVPLQVVKNGEILLGYDDRKGYHLDLYDLKRGTSINLKVYANWGWYFSVTFAYVESLLPLNSGTYVWQREIERKRLQRRRMAKLQDKNILLNILVRLPVKTILRFRCVSKAWCKLLENPKFVKEHLDHAIERNLFSVMMHSGYGLHKSTCTLAYDPSTSTLNNRVNVNYPWRYTSDGIIFRGTCKGLVCVSPHEDNSVVLWNPATREYRKVPEAQIESCPDDIISYFTYGFGYDDQLDDFKVVCIAGFEGESCCEVQVYTLGSDLWRRIEDIPYEFGVGEPDMARVSVNGAMHWIVKTDPMASETYKVIVSFEFKDDRFDEMPLPSFCDEYFEANLCSLGGSLCLLGSMHRGRIDVWEMKAYGVTESWEKNFTVEQGTICKFFGHLIPLQFVNNSEVLLGYDTGLDFCLDLYDLKRGTSINLKAHDDFDSYSYTTSVYVESLVSLDSGTYVGQDDQSEDEESESDDDSEEEDSEDDDDSEEEEQEEEEEDIETKRERLRRWEKYGIPGMNIGDVSDGKEEDEDCNGVEEDIKNKKKKAKLM